MHDPPSQGSREVLEQLQLPPDIPVAGEQGLDIQDGDCAGPIQDAGSHGHQLSRSSEPSHSVRPGEVVGGQAEGGRALWIHRNPPTHVATEHPTGTEKTLH